MKKSLKIIVALTLIVSMLAINASAMSIDWTSEHTGGGKNAPQVQSTTFDPIDVSEYGIVCIRVYISDPSLISPSAGNPSLELSSSGKCDNSEINWNLRGYDWKEGWNELTFAISKGSYSDGSTGRIDFKAINFCRLYLFTAGDEQVTIKLEGLEFKKGADYSALDAAIKAGEAKVALDNARNIVYSYVTKAAYDEAVAAAKKLDRTFTEADQAKVDEATKALNDAINGLKAGVSPWMYFVVRSAMGANVSLPVIGNLTTGALPATTTNPYNFLFPSYTWESGSAR